MKITTVSFGVEFAETEENHIEHLTELIDDFRADYDLHELTRVSFWLHTDHDSEKLTGSVDLSLPAKDNTQPENSVAAVTNVIE